MAPYGGPRRGWWALSSSTGGGSSGDRCDRTRDKHIAIGFLCCMDFGCGDFGLVVRGTVTIQCPPRPLSDVRDNISHLTNCELLPTGTHALSIRDRSGTSPAAAGSSGGGVMAEHPLGLLGASPPKSFGYEMLRFMAGSVAGSRWAAARRGVGRAGLFPSFP